MNAVDAYKLAWQEAERLGNFDEEILLRKLSEVTEWPPEDDDEDDEDDERFHDIPVWLSAALTPPLLDVMIGKDRLVGARSDLVWAFLQKVADECQGVDGDLSVWDPQDRSRHKVVAQMPRYELPPEYVKSVLDD